MNAQAREEQRLRQEAEHAAYVENIQRGIDPYGRAFQAWEAGLPIYQTELVISRLIGTPAHLGSSSNYLVRVPGADEILAQIEEIGWELSNVDYVFVTTGSTTSNRVLYSGQGEVTQGETHGVYLFRRRS